MRRGLALVFVFVVALSFISAGFLGDFFEKITGKVIQDGCTECDWEGGETWCPSGEYCKSSGLPPCIDEVTNPLSCGDLSCPTSCSEVPSCSAYECGSCDDVGIDCDPILCSDTCVGEEICSASNTCVEPICKLNNLHRIADSSSAWSTLSSDKGCCTNSNDCVYSGTCQTSGADYSTEYCYKGIWYGDITDVPNICGNNVCDSNEDMTSCPGDCECDRLSDCTAAPDCREPSCNLGKCSYTGVSNNGTSCSRGLCFSGICEDCIYDENCDDQDDSTEDECISNNCVFSSITWCFGGDNYCPTEYCNSLTDSDCAPSCDNGVIDEGETCSNCPGDVPCADNQKCSNGECVLNIVSYDFMTSSDVFFAQTEEKGDIQNVVKKITAEGGVTFTVDVLDSLPEGYEIPKGKKVVKILDIESSDSAINASLEFTIEKEMLDSSIDDVVIYVEGNSKTWETLDFEGDAGLSNGVYDIGIYTEHFSIFLITEPEFCGNGEFDSVYEECDESLSGVEGCLNCLCKAGFEPDGEGDCFEDFGGQGCPTPGEEKCSGYSSYNCSDENVWVNKGNVIGDCGVECIYGDSDCEGDIPKKCGLDYKWDLQERVSGLCGYSSTRNLKVEESAYEEDDPCADGGCKSNEREPAKEDGKNSSFWVGWLITGIILLIIIVVLTLVKIHNNNETK